MGRVILLQAEQSKGFLDGSRSSLRFQEVTCITELSGSIEVWVPPTQKPFFFAFTGQTE